MTVKEKLRKMLINNGMFGEQADDVLKEAIPKLENLTQHKITWNRPAIEYPDSFYEIMRMPLYETALEWIEDNAPQAWYRPAFENNND